MKQTTQYKNTAIGKIPIDWEVKKIKDVVYTASIPYKYQTKEYLNKGRFRIIDQGKSDYVGFSNDERHLIYDIPLVLFGDHTKIVKFINYPFCVGADGTKLLKSETVKNEYLFYVISQAVLKLPDLSYSRHFTELKVISIPIPPLPEQKAIAQVLSTWDHAIQKTEALLVQKELRKKWLMQQLLTGKKRLEGFENSKWKVQPLSSFIKLIIREIPKPNKPYLGIGLRSHGKGTFLKFDEQPEGNSMDKFYIVRPNDLIVNITFAWEQAIAIVKSEDDGALASHRFPTYQFIENRGNSDFFRFFILQPKMKYMLELISPGGAGRNRVMNKSDFIKLEFLLPDYEEQTAIAQVLQTADKEIELIKAKAAQLREQKKGLMQQLLTGKVRTV